MASACTIDPVEAPEMNQSLGWTSKSKAETFGPWAKALLQSFQQELFFLSKITLTNLYTNLFYGISNVLPAIV